jgi:hypothetical protein
MFNAEVRATYAEMFKTAMGTLPESIRVALPSLAGISKGVR